MSDSPDRVINIAKSLEGNTNNSLTGNDVIHPGNLNASISAIRQLADMHSDRLPATDEEVIVSISLFDYFTTYFSCNGLRYLSKYTRICLCQKLIGMFIFCILHGCYIQSVVRIASNLLSEKNDNAWQSLLQV